MARTTRTSRSTNRTSGAAASTTPTQQPPGRGLGRGAAASSGAIAAAAANATASAATEGVDGDILAVELNAEHAADIRDTTNHEMDEKTGKDHRRRNTEIINWMKGEYPDQFDHCVVELTEEERADPDRKYYTATHDFVYEKINPATIRAFLSGQKKYKDVTRTTQYSFVHHHLIWRGKGRSRSSPAISFRNEIFPEISEKGKTKGQI